MLWLLIFLRYAIYETIATATPICSKGETVNSQGLCIHIETTEMSWADVESFCVAHGGHLVSIHNQFDNYLVLNLATSAGLQYNLWTGASSSQGIYSWIDGTPFDFTQWSNGATYGNRCGLMHLNSNSGLLYTAGDWMSIACSGKYGFACERIPALSDCAEWLYKANQTTSGVYRIVLNEKPYNVYCDMESGGGWTVFQKYREIPAELTEMSHTGTGVGMTTKMNSNFWLGLDLLQQLTAKDIDVTLRIEMVGDRTQGSTKADVYYSNEYTKFKIANESNSYQLIDLYLDNKGDGINMWNDMMYSIGASFSTVERMNDPQINCEWKYKLGMTWKCYRSHRGILEGMRPNEANYIIITFANYLQEWTRCGLTIFIMIRFFKALEIFHRSVHPHTTRGWWLRNCALSSLNGDYDFIEANGYGLFWADVDGFIHPRMTRMMLRPTYISK